MDQIKNRADVLIKEQKAQKEKICEDVSARTLAYFQTNTELNKGKILIPTDTEFIPKKCPTFMYLVGEVKKLENVNIAVNPSCQITHVMSYIKDDNMLVHSFY